MSASFGRALDEAYGRCKVSARAAFGPFTGELLFETEAQRAAWTSALLPFGEGSKTQFSAAFVSDPAAFDGLLEGDRTWARYSDQGDHIAYWQGPPMSLLHLYERSTGRSLVWSASGDTPERIMTRPLLPILHAVTLDTPWLPLHSGAVGRNGRFLALAGGPGVGKTTATIACAAAGWDFAGDDFVLIQSETGQVEPLYSSARTRVNAPESLAALVEHTAVAFTDIAGDVRNELRFGRHDIGSRMKGGRVAAWLMPRRRGGETPAFERASAIAAFGALMPVTASRFPFGREEMNNKILRAIRRAPLYFVDTGTDPAAIPPAFARFLAELAA